MGSSRTVAPQERIQSHEEKHCNKTTYISSICDGNMQMYMYIIIYIYIYIFIKTYEWTFGTTQFCLLMQELPLKSSDAAGHLQLRLGARDEFIQLCTPKGCGLARRKLGMGPMKTALVGKTLHIYIYIYICIYICIYIYIYKCIYLYLNHI